MLKENSTEINNQKLLNFYNNVILHKEVSTSIYAELLTFLIINEDKTNNLLTLASLLPKTPLQNIVSAFNLCLVMNINSILTANQYNTATIEFPILLGQTTPPIELTTEGLRLLLSPNNSSDTLISVRTPLLRVTNITNTIFKILNLNPKFYPDFLCKVSLHKPGANGMPEPYSDEVSQEL